MGRRVTSDRPSKLAQCGCCHRDIPARWPPAAASTVTSATSTPTKDQQRASLSDDFDTPLFSPQDVYRVSHSDKKHTYVHQSCVHHNNDGLDVQQLSGETKIKAIISLVHKGKGKQCHKCIAVEAKQPTGAFLHCASVERCSRWFHLPCAPQVQLTVDADGQTITRAYCEDHSVESVGTLPPQTPATDVVQSSALPTSPVRIPPLASSPSSSTGASDDDGGGVSSVTAASTTAADMSSAAGFCQAALQEFVALLSDQPAGHLDLRYLQGMADGAIRQLNALLTRGVIAVMVGLNGVGKTTIINLLLFLTAMPKLQYAQEARKVVEAQLTALTDRSADQVYSRFSSALQSSTRGTRSRASSRGAALSSTIPSETAVLLSRLQQQLAKDKQYMSDGLNRFTAPLRVVSEPPPAAGDEDSRSSRVAAAGYVCLALNTKGNEYFSSDKVQAYLRSRWEAPLKEANERALTPDEILPWLLRSADSGVATTAHICRLLYAPVWHATVHFMTEELAQEVSFNYVAGMIDRHGKQAKSTDDDGQLQLAKAAYDALVSRPLSSFDWTQCPDITASEVERMLAADEYMTSPSVRLQPQYQRPRGNLASIHKPSYPAEQSLMPLSAEVLPLLGRALLLEGAGMDFAADREFVRRQLHFWTNCHAARHAILFCSVYAPCSVLNGVELWDTPGMDDRNLMRQWLLREALQQADVTMCVLQRGAGSSNTAVTELVKTRLLQRKVLSTDEVGHVAFLHYTEQKQRHTFHKFAEEMRSPDPQAARRDLNGKEQKEEVMDANGYTGTNDNDDDDFDSSAFGGSSTATTSLRALVRTHQVDSCEEVLNSLQKIENEAAADGGRPRTQDELRVLMERRVTFNTIFPVMFTSLLLRQSGEPEQKTALLSSTASIDNDEDVQRVLDFTGGYELCGLLRSCVPTLCQQLINRFLAQRGLENDEQADESMVLSDEEHSREQSEQHGGVEESKEEQVDAPEEFMQPESPHPTLDLLRRAGEKLQFDFPNFAPDSLLHNLSANIARFTLDHLDADKTTREVYERIRVASNAYGKYKHSLKWSTDTKNILEAVQGQSKAQQEEWEDKLVKAAANYHQLHIAPELLKAHKNVQRQFTDTASLLTIAQLDPKKNGLAKPVELRRVLLSHFSDISTLHAKELHSQLADTWEGLFDELKGSVFRKALRHMFPQVCHTLEFERAMSRVGDFALREPLLREWDDYMTCNDERPLQKKADQGFSQHHLFTQMQQLGKVQLQYWLESNWAVWKKRFANDKRRVLEEVRSGLHKMLDEVVERFGVEVQQRVRLTVRHFMERSFWWRPKLPKKTQQPSLLDDALKTFLREAHGYDREGSNDQLRSSLRDLLHELKRWDERVREVVQAIDKFDPAVLGRELVSAVQRNERYSAMMLNQKMSKDVMQLIKAAENRPQPLNSHSKLITGLVARAGALGMLSHWQQQQQLCPLSPTLPERIQQLNDQFRRCKQRLAVHDELSFGPGTSAESMSYRVDHLLRSVAVGVLTGGDPDSVDDSTERHVQELVVTLKSIVALKLSTGDKSTVGAAVREHYKCSSEQHNARLERGEAMYCPLILQLLATHLRTNFAVWTAESAAKGGKLRYLAHQTFSQPANKNGNGIAPAERYVHLVFLPQCVGEPSQAAALPLPYCLLPLFVAQGQGVSFSEVDEVEHYPLEERNRPLRSTRELQQSQRSSSSQRKRKPSNPPREQRPTSPSPQSAAQYPVSPTSTLSYDHQKQNRGARSFSALRSGGVPHIVVNTAPSRPAQQRGSPSAPNHATSSSQPNTKRIKTESGRHA